MKDLLKGHFRPEFLNRVDEMIVFHPLRKEQLTLIVDVQIDHLRAPRPRGLKLVLTDEAKKMLADEGYDPTLGARPLKRVIQQRLENPLAQRILAGEFKEGDTITVTPDAAKGEFQFEPARKSSRAKWWAGRRRVSSCRPPLKVRCAKGRPVGDGPSRYVRDAGNPSLNRLQFVHAQPVPRNGPLPRAALARRPFRVRRWRTHRVERAAP